MASGTALLNQLKSFQREVCWEVKGQTYKSAFDDGYFTPTGI